MAKTTKLNFESQILFDTQVKITNLSEEVGKFEQALNNVKLDGKATKSFETMLRKIGDRLPELQRRLSSGILDSRELTTYNKEADALISDLDKLSRALRAVRSYEIQVDSTELTQARKVMQDISRELDEVKKGPSFNISGLSVADAKTLQTELSRAAKEGRSVAEAFEEIRQKSADMIANETATLQSRQADLKDLETETLLLTEQLALHERIKKAFEERQASRDKSKQGYTPELRADVLAAQKEDTNAYQRNATLAEKIAEADQKAAIQAKQLAAAKQQEAEQRKRVEQSQRNIESRRVSMQNLDDFGDMNLAALEAFDQKVADIAQRFGVAKEEVDRIVQALQATEKGNLDKLADDVEAVTRSYASIQEQIKQHTKAQEDEKRAADQSAASFKNKIAQMLGMYNIYQLMRRAIRSAYQSIKELDGAMNEIAVVTDMTTDQLWGQIDAYMAVAEQYGVATKGVYEVSKLYYQQGRNAAEVVALTAETLKMAKIAGLDYAKATDHMTVALNGFKLAAEDASMVVDVYSKLAATSATDTQELAYAMSKTASIAESAGMSFENTSVFLAQMIETTREAPENIGTAMKTIIARFQEMKKSPLELVDVEGEEVSFNRVDKALQSIGMTLQDTGGQFKDLDDVIYELADKWDTLDRNTQRYIATIVAGSRQQSRFLALMQDSERLQEMSDTVQNAEDAGLIQYAKTLDSLESKLNQLSTSFQQLYMNIINGPLVKFFVDAAKAIVDVFKNVPPLLLTTIIPAIITAIRKMISTVGTNLIKGYSDANVKILQNTIDRLKATETLEKQSINRIVAYRNAQEARRPGGRVETLHSGALDVGDSSELEKEFLGKVGSQSRKLGAKLQKSVSTAFTVMAVGSMLIVGVEKLRSTFAKNTEELVEEYKSKIEETNIRRAGSRDELRNLISLRKEYDKLEAVKDTSVENQEKWNNLQNEIAEKYPELIDYIDQEGNYVLNLVDSYKQLEEAKRAAYKKDLQANIQANVNALSDNRYLYRLLLPEGIKAESTIPGNLEGGLQRLFGMQEGKDKFLGEMIDGAFQYTSNAKTEEEFYKGWSAFIGSTIGPNSYFKGAQNLPNLTQIGIIARNESKEIHQVLKEFIKSERTLDENLTEYEDQLIDNWRSIIQTLDYANDQLPGYAKSMVASFFQDWNSDKEIESTLQAARLQKEMTSWFNTKSESDGPKEALNQMFFRSEELFDEFNSKISNIYSVSQKSDSLKKAEDIWSNRNTLSESYLEQLMSGEIEEYENIRQFFSDQMIEELTEHVQKRTTLFVNGFLGLLKEAGSDASTDIFGDLGEEDLSQRISELGKGLSIQIQDKLLSEIGSLFKIEVGKDSIFTSGSNQTGAIKGLVDLYDLVYSGEYANKGQITKIFDATDPTSRTGLAGALFDLEALDIPDDDATKIKIKKKIDEVNKNLSTTEAEMFNFMSEYEQASADIQKLVEGKLDFQTVGDLLTKGFTLKDFKDGFTKFANPEEAAEKLMARYNSILESVFGDEEIPTEIREFAKAEAQRIIREKQQNLLKSIANVVKFDGSRMTFSEEQYNLLTDPNKGGLAEGLFHEELGEYVFSGVGAQIQDALIRAGEEDAPALISMLSEGTTEYFTEMAELFSAGGELSEDQIKKFIASGILDEELFDETQTKFVSDAQRAAAEEIIFAPLDILQDLELVSPRAIEIYRRRGEEIQLENTEALLRNLFGGIDFATGKITIKEDDYKELKDSVLKGLFGENAQGDFEFQGEIPEFLERYSAYVEQHGEGIILNASLLHDAMEKAYQTVVKDILKPSEESITRLRQVGGFEDVQTARAIATMIGADGDITKSEDTGLWNIKGIKAFTAMSEALRGININIYSFINYLDESYSGAQGLLRLDQQIADAEEKANLDAREKGEQYWEAMAQLAQYSRKQAELIFSPDTYSFMSNSPTNEKLAPMYALFENVKQAQDVLAEASQQNGKIQIKDYHAMLDYVKTSKKVGKDTVDLLSSVEKEFSPTLETELTDETIKAFGEAIQIKAKEDVDRYNEVVRENNKLIEDLRTEQAGVLAKDIMFGGETYKAGDPNEARKLAEVAYSTLSVKDSLAVNALANYLKERDGLDGAEAFAEALRSYQYDSPELAELQNQTALLEQLAEKFGIDISELNEDGTPKTTDAQRLEEQKATITTLEETKLTLEKQNENLEKQLQQKEEKITAITEERDALQERLNTLSSEKEAQDESSLAKINELEQQIQSLTADKEALRNELDANLELIETLNTSIAELNNTISQLEQGPQPAPGPAPESESTPAPPQTVAITPPGPSQTPPPPNIPVDVAIEPPENWGQDVQAALEEAQEHIDTPVLNLGIEVSDEEAAKLEAMMDIVESTSDIDVNNMILLLNNLGDGGLTRLAEILDITEPEEQFKAFVKFIKEQSFNINDITLDLSEAERSWNTYKNMVNGAILTPKIQPTTPNDPGVPAHAAGTRDAKTGPALVGELGPEIVVSDSQFRVVGKDGPELTSLRRGDIVLNHVDTARVFKRGLTSGQAFPYGTPWDKVKREEIEYYNFNDPNAKGKKGENKGEKDSDFAEFDRWYNYLQLIEDLSRAVAELQAQRENLFGQDYTKSLVKEIGILEHQIQIQEKFQKAQEDYLQRFENTKVKQYGEYLKVIGGVLQIEWDKLNSMDKEAAEPIQKVIEEWESLKGSISDSRQQVEQFIATQKELRDEMRDTYIDVEKQVIDSIKYQHQMRIDNLQKELDMKVKYDNKYLDSLRKNIDKERKLRERADQEEDRAKLQRKLALLKRDTSGKSATAIAQTEEELRNMNRSAYDQRQDDFVQDEEQALLAAQEAIQNELELQTEVLDLIDNNIQLIQDKIDAIMNSGPENLATFLTNWSQEYQNSTPTNQTKMDENFTDLAGKVQGYLLVLQGAISEALSPLNTGLAGETNLDPNATGSGSASDTGGSGSTTKPKAKTYYGYYYNPQSGAKHSVTSTKSQADADAKAKKKQDELTEAYLRSQMSAPPRTGSTAPKPVSVGYNGVTLMPYATGGLVDYTGPALVHGSKQKPEMVLNPTQTGIFQRFVDLMDQNFGKNIQSSMIKPKSFDGAPDQTTVIVEKIILESGVIARDYDARRAGDLIEEKILNIAKYKGNMSLKR